MHGWKRGKPYAMVVCPIYQLPNSSSQIYQQATTQNVCIFTYSHLALLLAYSEVEGKVKAEQLLKKVFETVNALNHQKMPTDYWLAVNKTILFHSKKIEKLGILKKALQQKYYPWQRKKHYFFLHKNVKNYENEP